jgi:hypothetical protein
MKISAPVGGGLHCFGHSSDKMVGSKKKLGGEKRPAMESLSLIIVPPPPGDTA